MKVDTLHQALSELLLTLIQVDQGSKDSVQLRTTALELGVILRLRQKTYFVLAATYILTASQDICQGSGLITHQAFADEISGRCYRD